MRAVRLGAISFAGIAMCISAGCDDPQSSRGTIDANAFRGNYDGAVLEFQLDGSSGQPTTLVLFADSLVFDSASEELRARVAVQNQGRSTVLGPERIEVFGFVPSTVTPLNALCDSTSGDCGFDYRGAYGEDGLLLHGETSAPVEWRLHVPGGESFGFRARLGTAIAASGSIAGVVFHDLDGDGGRDAGEPGLADQRVRLRFGTASRTARTNAFGRYEFTVDAPGLYAIHAEPGSDWHPTVTAPLEVAILRQSNGSLSSFTAGHLGLTRGPVGPTLHVTGVAFRDLDRDGVQDTGEPGIGNLKIEGKACDTAKPVIADDDEYTTRTDANGAYLLVLPDCGGPWKIEASSVDGHDRTTPKSLTFVTPPGAGTSLEADFGYAVEDISTRWEIRGVVFRDDDGDRIHDLNEPGIPGVLVTADGTACDAPVVASDRTDERGRFEIDGSDIACPLPWSVHRAELPGTIATTPASVVLNVAPFDERFNIDFGVRPSP